MGGSPQTPAETESEVLRLYRDQGLGGKRIAAALGIGVTTVYSILRRAGIQRDIASRTFKNQFDPVAELTAENIVSLYKSGVSGPDIGAKLAVPYTTVYRKLKEAGVSIPKRGRGSRLFALTPQDEESVVRLYQEGSLRNVLAKQFGCNPHTIRNILIRHGVESRYRRLVLSPQDKDQIVTRYLAGETQESIARSLCIRPGHIGVVLHSKLKGQHRPPRLARRLRTDMPEGYIGAYVPMIAFVVEHYPNEVQAEIERRWHPQPASATLSSSAT